MKNILVLALFLVSQIGLSQIDYKAFEGEKGQIKFFKQYPLSNIYDYGIDAEGKDSLIVEASNGNFPEALISNKFASELFRNKKDSIVFSVRLITRLVVEVQNKRHSLISYSTSQKNGVSVIDYVETDGWTETNASNNEIDLMKSIIQNVTADIVFEFYNKRNNDKYPEINQLKASAKNESGVLDIKKLQQVVTENRNKLTQYME